MVIIAKVHYGGGCGEIVTIGRPVVVSAIPILLMKCDTTLSKATKVIDDVTDLFTTHSTNQQPSQRVLSSLFFFSARDLNVAPVVFDDYCTQHDSENYT